MREVRDAVHHDTQWFASRDALREMRRLKEDIGVHRKTLRDFAAVGKPRPLVVLAARPATSVKRDNRHKTVDVL
jgi:hypothetical protein